MSYNLSIWCVDGDTIYGLISNDKKKLLDYLIKYNHEGSSINLKKEEGDRFINYENPEEIYKELSE